MTTMHAMLQITADNVINDQPLHQLRQLAKLPINMGSSC